MEICLVTYGPAQPVSCILMNAKPFKLCETRALCCQEYRYQREPLCVYVWLNLWFMCTLYKSAYNFILNFFRVVKRCKDSRQLEVHSRADLPYGSQMTSQLKKIKKTQLNTN